MFASVQDLIQTFKLKILLFIYESSILYAAAGMAKSLAAKLKKVVFKDDEVDTHRHNNGGASFQPVTDDGHIQIHPDTLCPTRAWQMLRIKQIHEKKKPISMKTPISPKKVRFVCLSDTHNKTSQMREPVPDGDVLLHAGDFSMVGHPKQIEEFNNFLGKLPHKHKVVIAGNHDLTFDPDFLRDGISLRRFGLVASEVKAYLAEKRLDRMADVLTNCTDYLEDSETQIYGIRIYGSPWQPWFGDWGFNLDRGGPCLEKWNKIPKDVDILMTHGPPLGHGDYCSSDENAGCVELLHTIQHRVKPKYHIFGHIHEGYGVTTDGFTTYINASTTTLNYRPTNPAIVFDIPLPEGYTKDDIHVPRASVSGRSESPVDV